MAIPVVLPFKPKAVHISPGLHLLKSSNQAVKGAFDLSNPVGSLIN